MNASRLEFERQRVSYIGVYEYISIFQRIRNPGKFSEIILCANKICEPRKGGIYTLWYGMYWLESPICTLGYGIHYLESGFHRLEYGIH